MIYQWALTSMPASAIKTCYEKRSDRTLTTTIKLYRHYGQRQRTSYRAALGSPVFTVRDAMIACGVNNFNLFEGDMPAQRIATDLFGDDYATCMDKGLTELDYEFKTYSELTILQGQIRLLPGIKRTIKAFIQWVQDERRL
jgi:hypothetical protein